jgi:hypothetical protein
MDQVPDRNPAAQAIGAFAAALPDGQSIQARQSRRAAAVSSGMAESARRLASAAAAR